MEKNQIFHLFFAGKKRKIGKTRNKSNAYFKAPQYRQDLLDTVNSRREHTSLSVYVVQKITIICMQKIKKSAV